MNRVTASGTFEVIDMTEWRDRAADAEDQARLDDVTQTLVYAIVLTFALISIGSLIMAIVS